MFNGTALLVAELVAPAEVAPLLGVAAEAAAESALVSGIRVFADGVYKAEVVNAFDPADEEPEAANDDAAAAPMAPAEEFDWMYRRLRLPGSC